MNWGIGYLHERRRRVFYLPKSQRRPDSSKRNARIFSVETWEKNNQERKGKGGGEYKGRDQEYSGSTNSIYVKNKQRKTGTDG